MTQLPNQREFIEYLNALAPEGETLLLARQKPTAGQTYGDGTPRYTWPPMLPATKIKKDWAIYANTGSFVLNRMKARVSASAVNCDYVLVMVLDDIGTKSAEPPLQPTWKIETSEGNYQWGYVFSDQPLKEEFAGAVKAVAAAGYTDGGCINPVRNFRIPGSVNLKTGKGGFVSRLVEFNPEVDYTLAEICKALKVKPEEVGGKSYKSTSVKRTDDEVLSWLSENELVLSGVNQDGWCQIVCPNFEEHGDPMDVMAKYKPADRGFCCYHEHCSDWDSKRFLNWVRENGGPDVEHGESDDEASEKYARMMGKVKAPAVTPTPPIKEVIDAAEAMQERVAEQAASEAEERLSLFERYIYLEEGDQFFDVKRRMVLSRSTFNALNRHIPCLSTLFDKPRRIEPGTWFDENRVACGGTAVRNMTYAPGEDVIVEIAGTRYANSWKDGRPVVPSDTNVDVSIWLDHCRNIIEEEDELEHFLDVMAYKLQHPEVKINHALMLCGVQGCGKDTMFEPLMRGIGGFGVKLSNCSVIDTNHGKQGWSEHLECEVMVLNELKEPTSAERRALANELKPIIAAPPDMLTVNKKYQPRYQVVNRLLLIAYSNERNPISLSSDDRRWMVVWTELRRQPAEYYKRIWDWYKNGGIEACISWLYQRDVSAFNPKATPKFTNAKESVIDASRSTAESWLIQQIEGFQGEFQLGAVASSFTDMADRLEAIAPSRTKIHHSGIVDALQECGWHSLGRIHSRAYPTKKDTWVSEGVYQRMVLGTISRSEIRAMVEHPASNYNLGGKDEGE